MTRATWVRLAACALAVFLTRAPFVPPSLEDYDSVNFALALQEFDPLLHQPHPPGYPVYVALARAVEVFVPEPSLALGLLSALAQALAVFAAFAVFSSLERRLAWPALLLLFSCPAVWFNGARPLSDSVGLLFALTAQALLLRQLETGRGLLPGSLVAGLAVGVRLQSVLLTLPLWLLAIHRRGPRVKAATLLALGVAAWLIPLLAISGGPTRYLAAFGETMGMALDLEPLFTRFSLNLAARAAAFVLIGPWVVPWLGVPALALALLGARQLAAQNRAGLALALVCFAPYLAAHALFQQVEAVRYALPYVPLLCLLMAGGLAWLAGLMRVPEAGRAGLGLAGLVAAGSAALTLPALWVYAAVESPPAAAINAVRAATEGRLRDRSTGPGFRRGPWTERGRRRQGSGSQRDLAGAASEAGSGREAAPRSRGFALASHYTLQRYLAALPESLEVLPSGPNDTVPKLIDYWLGGGRKQVLFLADARRTDLASLESRSQHRIGRWDWPLGADRFMPGARPARTELLRIGRPGWMAGSGWLLSLEAGRPDEVARLPERRAYLRSLERPAFLIVAGEPVGAGSPCTLELDRDGEPLASLPCSEPFLHGLALAPSANDAYGTLRARPIRSDTGGSSPVLLRGLDYGPWHRSGWAHGAGWHYLERDERGLLFRWTSAQARSLVHVPSGGATLVVEGTAPTRYVGLGGAIRLQIDGAERARAVVDGPSFRLTAWLDDGPAPFREVTLGSERTFVPHEFQRSDDHRLLGVRIYRFELRHRPADAPRNGPAPQAD